MVVLLSPTQSIGIAHLFFLLVVPSQGILTPASLSSPDIRCWHLYLPVTINWGRFLELHSDSLMQTVLGDPSSIRIQTGADNHAIIDAPK